MLKHANVALAAMLMVYAINSYADGAACREPSSTYVVPTAEKVRVKPLSGRQGTVVGEEVQQEFRSPAGYTERGTWLSDSATKAGEAHVIHQDTIRYEGAAYIAPHFSAFDLAPGDYIVVRSPDASRSWRYEGYGKSERLSAEGFWGIHIPGDTAVVELYSRGGHNKRHAGYTIDRFARGFKPEELDHEISGSIDGVGAEAICGADDSDWAQCYASTSIYNHSRPVARLLINGISACTGWLVGNQGHLMTNNHCISTANDASNTDFEFMAEGSSCSASCASWGACPGTIVATSATLIKTDASRDYTLLKLPTNPSGTYGYLQFRIGGATVGERIYVPQHPAAWGKKIAVNSSQPSDSGGYARVYSLYHPPCLGNSPTSDIAYYADTQGGSSGSPVIGYSDNLVLALHHCGDCPNRGVPITTIYSQLGTLIPPCAIRSLSCPDPIGGYYCGDTLCGPGETYSNCSQDCGYCGDGKCGQGETPNNCSRDCCRSGARCPPI